MNKPVINSIKMQTKNRFLNLFELDITNTKKNKLKYFVASRNESIEDYTNSINKNKIDAVCILASDDKNRVVLVRQWRYPCNDFIYELPAGIIDNNETIHETAIREFKEETGLDFEPTSSNEKSYFTAVGITNERIVTVYGKIIGGEITNKYQEKEEDIEIIFVDKEEAQRILQEEKVSIGCALTLRLYFNI